MNVNMFDVCFLCFILSHIAAYTDTWAIQQPFHHIIYHLYTALHWSITCICTKVSLHSAIVHIHNIMHLYSHSCQQCDDIIFAMQYFHYSLILCCLRKSRFNLCQKQRSCLSSEICYHTHLSFFTFHRLNVSQISSRLGSLNYREQCQLWYRLSR